VRYISGKETTAAAITVAGQEKTIETPMRRSNWPSGPWRPKSSRRRKPTTVGGRTSGRRAMPSKIAKAEPLRRSRQAAAATPRIRVMAVATMLVAREIQTG
jgi:hypothetical protein